MKTKKELREEYKSTKLKVGIFQISNKVNSKVFLKTSMDLDRAYNSDLFQLNSNVHANSQLQNDWISLGATNFEFSIVDELISENEVAPTKIRQDLQELLQMHITDKKNNGILLY